MPKIYMHIKTGKIYEIVHEGAMIESEGLSGLLQVVYKSQETGQVWVRPLKEFYDGRFQYLGEKESDVFDPIADITAFHEKFELPERKPLGALDSETMDFRYKFMMEELSEWRKAQEEALNEVTRASKHRDEANYTYQLEEALDGLVDLAYVLFGTVYLHGFKDIFGRAWKRVHKANMEKVRAELISDSKRGSTQDVVKPAGWEAPSHTDLIEFNHDLWEHLFDRD